MPTPKRGESGVLSHPLHIRVGLSVVLLILGLALTLSFVLERTAERQLLAVEADQLNVLADQMARDLAQGMDQFAREVVAQTHDRRFNDARSTPEEMRKALNDFKSLNPEFAYVSIVDVATARVIAANGGIFEGGLARGRPTFEEGLKGPFLGDVHQAVRLAELLPKPASGEGLRFLDVSAPIRNAEGQVFRVFASHVAWEWTASLRERLFQPMQDRRGVELLLLDTAGKVVLAASPALPVGTPLPGITARQGQPPQAVEWMDGHRYLTVVKPVQPRGHFPNFGWRVVARQPASVTTAPLLRLRLAFLSGGTALGLCAAALGWLLSARLVRPVRELAEHAQRIEAGGDASAAPPSESVQELSTVHRALARLADTARAEATALSASQQRFALLSDTLPQLVWLADADGTLQYLNKPWLEERRRNGQLVVSDLEHLILQDDCAHFAAAWQKALQTAAELQLRCRVKSPEHDAHRWFDIRARPLKDEAGQLINWIGTMFDVHEAVTLNEATERALATERRARANAERLARLQDQFLAIVSHELRSPLNAINGWAEILGRQASAEPMVRKASEVIRRNALLQSGLINDLLDMSAVTVGKLKLNKQVVDLTALARDVRLSYLHAAQLKGVALSCADELPIVVDADRQRITQVIGNLVGNAIKFTEAGGRVDITVWSQAGQARLCVADSGQGISAEFLPHVFDRLRQEDSSATRRAGGLGLGLSIARALLELHQGRIEVESAGIGRGARFTVTLPLADDAAEDAAGAPHDGLATGADTHPQANLSGLHVLLVDDEADARDVAQVALSSLGARVTVAAGGEEALRRLAADRFDLLVSDLGMPGMDGLALIAQVRCQEALRELPAVALTAFALPQHEKAARDAGFHAFATKPISISRLAEAAACARGAATHG